MLVLEAIKIKKHYGDRLLFSIDNLIIYQNDRIGIVGVNGCGKTTLLNILTGKESPCEGSVRLYGKHAYITQLQDTTNCEIYRTMEKRFQVNDISHETSSGGETTRLKIARAFSANCSVLFADEPTCNLDMDGIRLLEEQMKNFYGALVLISHDRALLNTLCNRILEIDNGKVSEYPGNYSDYMLLKEAGIKRRQFEYEQYVNEKKRLSAAIAKKKQQAGAIRKAPSRMGNSEARLHKRKSGQKMAKVEKASSGIKKRLMQLEHREKPAKPFNINIDLKEHSRLYCRAVITVKRISKSFGNKSLFNDISFEVSNGRKVALIGNNGSGKTTLLNMITGREKGIDVAQGVNIGYFRQDLGILDEMKTILENVLKDSIYPLSDVRLILARLLFRDEVVHKRVALLSGGERVKTALAKIIVGGFNMILLDEPTNYLDVYSLAALEQVLKEYRGTILFVSHDLEFINQIADHVIVLQNGKAVQYPGKYNKYLQHKKSLEQRTDDSSLRIMQLENRLSEVIGRLCTAKKEDTGILDAEYKEILAELKQLRDGSI